MVPFEFRQTRGVAAGVLVLAIAVASCIAVSQPVFEPVADDERQRQLVEQLQRIESQQGLNSPESIDLLKALALTYQESGDHALAEAAIELALHVVRVNYGVYSLEQAPLIQQSIHNEEAGGNDERAWEREKELLTLVRRHPDDLRTVPMLREIAGKRLDVLDRHLAGERPPQIVLGCYYDWTRNDGIGSCHAGSKSGAVQTLVLDAQRNYADAIAVILRNGLLSSAELRNLEMELVRSADFARHSNELEPLEPNLYFGLPPPSVRGMEPWRSAADALLLLADWDLPLSPDAPVVERGWLGGSESEVLPIDGTEHAYRLGRLALQRLFKYELASSAPTPRLTEAVIAIADWDLLYSHNDVALEGYELAYRMLQEAAEAQASIDKIFAPELPVVLPAFVPNPLVAAGTEEPTGYVDVAFELTKYGISRRIEILDATTNATDADKDDLVRLIERNRFRPRPTAGEFVRTPSIAARYPLYE